MRKTALFQAYLASLHQVDWVGVYRLGYRLILLDVDNTLQAHGQVGIDEGAKTHLLAIQEAGLEVALVSNSSMARAKRLQAHLDEFITKPVPLYGLAGKPSPKRLLEATAKATCRPEQVLFFGDQYFTDVLAAKRGNIDHILLKPICTDEPWYIRLKRIAENLCYRTRGIRCEQTTWPHEQSEVSRA